MNKTGANKIILLITIAVALLAIDIYGSIFYLTNRETRVNNSNKVTENKTNKPSCFTGNDTVTWKTGAESVPEYLKFKKDLIILTEYLDCKCEDDIGPYCYSCVYDPLDSTYIYYYDDKFIIPPHEYSVTNEGIEKKELSLVIEGFTYLFDSEPVDLTLIKD